MKFPVLLSALLLASSSASAVSFPRTSIEGTRKAVYQKRQASTKDVVRRLREGPLRKRQVQSPGVCPNGVGVNVIQNPGFEADSGENPYPATSWTADRTTSTMPIAYTDGYGYNPSSPMSGDDGHAFVTRSAVGNDPGMATVTQTGIKVCGLYTYAFELYVGRKAQAQSDHGDCKIEVMLTQGSTSLVVYSEESPCGADEDCMLQSSDPEKRYGLKTYDGGPIRFQESTDVTVQATFSCGPDLSDAFMVDGFNLRRTG